MHDRAALLVTTSNYEDPGLANLRSTGVDGNALAQVLQDPEIGAYKVYSITDDAYHKIGERVGEFLADRSPTDTLLLYLSGHGLKNHDGELYFAGANTRLDRLEDTSLPASRLSRQIERSRAGRVILLLDCCYAGAFPAGVAPKAGTVVDVSELKGDGRVVITASSATEYAFEGRRLEAQEPSPSLFTQAVALGLRSGDADVDRDGIVSPSDLFTYVSESLRETMPQQTPIMHATGLRGTVEVAKNPYTDEPSESRPAPRASQDETPVAPVMRRAEPLSALLESFLDKIEAVAAQGSREFDQGFVSTGIEELDELTGGYRTGELALLTGDAGSGKSILALNSARATALHANRSCLVVSLESSQHEVVTRLVSAEARIPVRHIQHGWMNDADWGKLARKMGEIGSAPLFVVDQSPGNLRSLSKSLAEKHDLALVIIDSLQMLSEISEPAALVGITRALKLLAKEFNVAIVATVMKEPELRTPSGPIGAIDRYADLVIEILREEMYDIETMRPGEADLSVLRNRRGPTGTVVTAFQGHYARFVDLAMYPSTVESSGASRENDGLALHSEPSPADVQE